MDSLHAEGEISVGACVTSLVGRASSARRLLYRNATRDTVPQFPCVLQRTGDLAVSPSYLRGVRDADMVLNLESWGWDSTSALLSKADLMRVLGIFVHRDSKMIKNSSHGEIWFGSIRLAEEGQVVQVAIKFMPIQLEQNDLFMRAKITNAAYVDPFISWLGSRLVSRQESCAFAQLFGTFVCRGRVGAVKDGSSMPLVAMVSEELGMKLDTVMISYIVPGAVKWRELVGVVLQAMVALSQAHAMTFVHNDAHMGNFLVAKTCTQAQAEGDGIFFNVNGTLLRVPATHRVVLMDFGRATIAALDCDERRCTRATGSRLQSTEVKHRFPKWDLDNPGADVSHFFAMLMLCQESPSILISEAARPSAPPMARALVRLMRRALSCGTGTDMFASYDACNTAELKAHAEGQKYSCGKDLVHELRERDSLCRGIPPMAFLTDEELTAPFRISEMALAPSDVVYLPVPSSLL